MRISIPGRLSGLAFVALAAIAAGQQAWDEPSSFGSYQPIAPQAYSDSEPGAPAARPLPQYAPQAMQASTGVPAPRSSSQPTGTSVDPAVSVPYTGTGPCQDCTGCEGFPNGIGSNYPLLGRGNRLGEDCRPSALSGKLFRGRGDSPDRKGCDIPDADCDGRDWPGQGYYGSCRSGRRNGGIRFSGDPCDTGRERKLLARRSGGNWIGGVNGLVFFRDLEDDLGLGFNSLSDYLYSTDSAPGAMGGVEAMLGRRGCSGWGWEARYWGLFPNQSDVMFGNTPYSTLAGLTQIRDTVSGFDALQIYNSASSHRLYRDNSFSNVEINLLRNGGCFGACGRNNFELFGGFRWFQFDEAMRYAAFSSAPGYPAQFNYDVDVQNQLLGSQFGGRIERCVSSRLRLTGGLGLGIYNNSITHTQRMFEQAGGTDARIWSGPFSGQDYDCASTKNDIAMMGEMNAGIYWLFSQNVRFNAGYRALGVTGVALSPDQIPYNFTDVNDIHRVNSNGSLILHGAYAGFQVCY